MKLVSLLLVPLFLLSTPQYISEPFNEQTTIEIHFNDPLKAANTNRTAALLSKVFSLGCVCAPAEITVYVEPYKKFESRAKKYLTDDMRWFLEKTGLFIFAFSDIDDKEHLKIYTSPQGVNSDLVMVHEAYHYIVAYCLALGTPHSDELVNKLALTFLGSKRYKDWLRDGSNSNYK